MLISAAIEVNGMIFVGLRHHVAMAKAKEAGISRKDIQGAKQGFMTDQGMFLDREAAKEYAKKIGQIVATKSDTLCSEDLW